ncbi:MAG: hypothetical protein M0020_03775, partial [Actinomycetota bacterium]|nr:hypothetical protein [Actinomycetota bacterium]
MRFASQRATRAARSEGDLRYARRRRREALGAAVRALAFVAFCAGTPFAVHIGTEARFLPFPPGDWRNAWATRLAWALYGLLVATIVVSALRSRSRWARQRARQNAVPPGWLAHVVAEGESLGSIARDEVGDRSAWLELWRHNANRAQPGGGRLIWPDQTLAPGWVIYHPRPKALDLRGLTAAEARELRDDLDRQTYFAHLCHDTPAATSSSLATVPPRYLPHPWVLAVAAMLAERLSDGALDPTSLDPEWSALANAVATGRWHPRRAITVESTLVAARALPPAASVRALARATDGAAGEDGDLVAQARAVDARRDAAVANLVAGRPAEDYEALPGPAREVAVALVAMAYFAGSFDILSITNATWRRAAQALYWQVRCADGETLPLAEGVVRNPQELGDHHHGSPAALADALSLG